MTVYLLENEVGHDPQCIGFPSLLGCMAVVLQTNQGLFGWHIYGSGTINERIGAFYEFLMINNTGTSVHLYGTCNRKERFAGDFNKWKQEMWEIAAGIGYRGPVSGFDLSRNTGIGHESSYAEYIRDGGARRCGIYYKRWSKMVAHDKQVIPDNVVVKRISKRGTDYVLEGLYKDKAMTQVDLVTTRSNKGRLHQASLSRIDTFTL